MKKALKGFVPVMVLLASGLPGCLAPPAQPVVQGPDDATDTTGVLRFEPPTTLTKACQELRGVPCFEPTIAADPLARVFVTPGWADQPMRSLDGGRSFQRFAVPSAPPQAPASSEYGDATFVVDDEGTLWFHALAFDKDRIFGQSNAGVVVARSHDGGATWAGIRFLGFPTVEALPLTTSLAADRQWLVFSTDGTVYLTVWNFALLSVLVAVSADQGDTWSPFRIAVTLPERMAINPAGLGTVDDEGRLFVPFNAAPQGDRKYDVWAAVSEDRGVTFRKETVYAGADHATIGHWPTMGRDHEGSVLAAWTTHDGRVVTSERDGETGTWGTPSTWSRPGDSAVIAPKVLSRGDDAWDVVYYTEDGIHLARGMAGGPIGQVTVGHLSDDDPLTTDFADFAHLPDGRAAVTWTSASGGIKVAVEKAAIGSLADRIASTTEVVDVIG